MAKTQEELNILKKEYEALGNKLKELTEEEVKEVVGAKTILPDDGFWEPFNPYFDEIKNNNQDK